MLLLLSLDVSRFSSCNRRFIPKAGYRAKPNHIDAYSTLLRQQLSEIHIPADAILFRDVLCCDPLHLSQLNFYVQDIIQACLRAAKAAISHTSVSISDRIPGWNEFVKPVKENIFSGTQFGLSAADLNPV